MPRGCYASGVLCPGVLCPRGVMPQGCYALGVLCPRGVMPKGFYALGVLCPGGVMPQGCYAQGVLCLGPAPLQCKTVSPQKNRLPEKWHRNLPSHLCGEMRVYSSRSNTLGSHRKKCRAPACVRHLFVQKLASRARETTTFQNRDTCSHSNSHCDNQGRSHMAAATGTA